jgi:transcriptional regulator with XRE-family HTH domain
MRYRDEMNQCLGQQFRSERKRRGLTQSDLALLMRTSQSAVSRLESAAGAGTIATLRRAASALKCELDIELVSPTTSAMPQAPRRARGSL